MVQTAEIEAAGRLLRGGELVAFPTETVYGLGAHALDSSAVARVFEAKGRPHFDPLIVHVAEADAAWALADLEQLPEAVRHLPGVLAAAFWPGPLTLVVPCRRAGAQESRRAGNDKAGGGIPGVPGIVTAGLGTVGLRGPGHTVARALIEAAGVPVAAPSANAFGGISPTRAEHVTVPCATMLDGGPCATGVESTVVGFDAAGVVVLRLGGTPVEAIEQVVAAPPEGKGDGKGVRPRFDPGSDPAAGSLPGVRVARPGQQIASPGMLDRHYAPRTPLRLVDRLERLDPASVGGRTVGVLSLRGQRGRGMGFAASEVLSATGDLTEAAARLFDAMHRLDAAGLELIVAEAVPEAGLGRAINDRLRRAATP
jgi:L-threonylcarbamoyladenylate synthase